MNQLSKFIGKTPQEVGFCWGLLRLAYADHGISLPIVDGLFSENAVQRADEVRDWLSGDWIPTDTPKECCAVAMSQFPDGRIHHVGIYSGGLVIHAWGSHRVVAEDFRRLRLKGFTTIKFYCHKLWPT